MDNEIEVGGLGRGSRSPGAWGAWRGCWLTGLGLCVLLTEGWPAAEAVAGPPPPASTSITAAEPALAPVAGPEPTTRPLLWEIAGFRPSYLYGTIHVPDPRVLALPPVVRAALASSDAVFTELALGPFTKLSGALQMMLPLGESLESSIPPPLLERAAVILRHNQLDLEPFLHMKVWVLTVTVGLVDLLPQLADGVALDEYLFHEALRGGQEAGGLETVAEQVDAFDGLSMDEQVELLRVTLDELDRTRQRQTSPAEELIRVYLAGDEEALFRKALLPLQPGSALERKTSRLLITERNQRMAARIQDRLRERPDRSCFFAVGAGHFAGPDSLLRLLKEKGLKIKRLQPADLASIPARRMPSVPRPATASDAAGTDVLP